MNYEVFMIWSKDRANKWYRDKGWVIGFNYVPSSAVNSTEMWMFETYDAEAVNKELGIASETGFNSCRVFLQFLVWEAERDGFLDTFDSFLSTAAKHGISVMPILFDDCAFAGNEPFYGKQQNPVPGVTNSGWTASPGFLIADDSSKTGLLKEYVQTVVGKFAHDERILMWDMYNEPGNIVRGEKSISLLRNAFTWARECNPAQPLTAAVWEWKDAWENECLLLSDIISFHDYEPLDTTKKRVELLA